MNLSFFIFSFRSKNMKTRVIGCPKTIDGDLKCKEVPTSFGFDTACKVIINIKQKFPLCFVYVSSFMFSYYDINYIEKKRVIPSIQSSHFCGSFVCECFFFPYNKWWRVEFEPKYSIKKLSSVTEPWISWQLYMNSVM